MQRSAVGFTIDSGRRNAHLAASSYDPDGDFAAIGDEDFVKHAASIDPKRILARDMAPSSSLRGGATTKDVRAVKAFRRLVRAVKVKMILVFASSISCVLHWVLSALCGFSLRSLC